MCANEVSGIQYTTIKVKTPEGGVREVRMPQKQIEINLANNQMKLNRDGTYTLGKTDAPKPESTTTITTSIAGTELFKDRKVDPQLSEALKNVATIDNEGNVTLKAGITKEQFLNAVKQYCQNNSTVEPKLELEGDEEWKQHLVDEKAVSVAENNGEKIYTMQNKDKLYELTESDGQQHNPEKVSKEMDFSFTETTVTTPDEVEVPKGLLNDKEKQAKLETEYKSRLLEWKADPANADLKDTAIANMKYGKKVDKLAAKLEEKTYAKVAEEYINKYYTPEERANALKFVNDNAINPEKDGKSFAKLYNAVKLENEPERDAQLFSLTDADGNQKTGEARANAIRFRKAALLTAVGRANAKLAPEVIRRNYAVKEILSQRTDDEKVEDENYFVNEQAKRNVRGDVAEERKQNTRLFWNKAAKKAYIKQAENEGRDISNERLEVISRGDRKQAQKNGDFSKEVVPQANQSLKEGVDYDFTREYKDPITGDKKISYWKFDPESYTNYFDRASDTRFDAEKLAKDNHLTLAEENQAGTERNTALDEDYKPQSFESVRGFKKNDSMGYWERHHYGSSAKRAGFDVDKDRTQLIRGGQALVDGAKAALFSFATAGAGAYIAGALKVAPEAIKWTSQGKYVDYNTPGFKKLVEGQEYKGEVTHQTVVNGKIYRNTTPYEGKTPDRWIEVDGQQGKVWVDPETGEVYSKGGEDNTYFKTALNAAWIGGGLAAISSLINSQDTQDKGTYWDGRINVNKKSETTTENTTGNIEYEQTIPVDVRTGTYTKGKKYQEFKNKPLQGPSAYSVMFHYEDGTPVNPLEFAHAYQKRINGQMSQNNFYVFDDLVDSKNRKIVPYEGTELQNRYNRIPNGTEQADTQEVSVQNTGKTYKGKAKITG